MRYVRFVSRKLALAMVTCLPPLQGSNTVLLQLLIFNTPWKVFRVERKNEELCAQGTGRTGFMSPVLVSPPMWKSTKILHGDDCSSWPAENVGKKYVLDCMYSLFTKITYMLMLPCLFRATSQSCLRCCLLSIAFTLPQIKLNSQLSHCAYF